jgi:hypothetical protein
MSRIPPVLVALGSTVILYIIGRRAHIAASICVLIICAGCAVHHPDAQAWRLVPAGNAAPILVPPGVESPEVARRSFSADVRSGPLRCAENQGEARIQPRNGHLRVTVTREALIRQPPGSLSLWAADLEARGCVAPGDGPRLAQSIAESLPLEANEGFRLLYSGDRRTGEMELGSGVRLQVTSPILREGAAPEAPLQISGSGNSLVVTGSTDLLGYETAWYRTEVKADLSGFVIVPISAERHLSNDVEKRTEPAVNYFRFPPEASYYRLFYKSGQTDFTAFVVAARTLRELDRISNSTAGAITSCQALSEFCAAIPRRVAVNPFVMVVMNGREVLISWGATLAEAIRESGERQPASLLPRLAISKQHDGRAAKIQFAGTGEAIMDLILTGGEIISWEKP